MAGTDAQSGDTVGPLSGGPLLAAISTSIVGILREHYGRGPMKAKTYVLDDIIVVVMRGSGFTALEQTIMDSGEPDRVIAMREDFQRVMADALQGDDRRAHRAQRPGLPQPGPRRARHHDGDLLRRRPARGLRRSRADGPRVARSAVRSRAGLGPCPGQHRSAQDARFQSSIPARCCSQTPRNPSPDTPAVRVSGIGA